LQPQHLATAQNPARGVIHQFRMSLWAEHLHCNEQLFLCPQDTACVREVNRFARKNWRMYADFKSITMQSHLMRYPLIVPMDGDIYPEPYCFPDTSALVSGKRSVTVPVNLTL